MIHKRTENIAITLYDKKITCIRKDLIIDDVHLSIYRVYSFIAYLHLSHNLHISNLSNTYPF